MVEKPQEEPKGWPLKRPLTDVEWRQVQKALVVRRVPEGRSISKRQLVDFVQDDLRRPEMATESTSRRTLTPGTST